MLIENFVVGFAVCLFFGIVSLKKKLVDTSGLLAGLIVGTGVFTFGGIRAFIPLLMFHLISGFFTHYKYQEKMRRGVAEFKGGARGWRNVFANGAIPLLAITAEYITQKHIWAAGYLGAIAAAISDTLSNEIGVLNPTYPIRITKPTERVKPGTPGGISPLGYFAAFLSSTLIGITGFFLSLGSEEVILTSIIAGLMGTTVDSIIGDLFQGVYKCRVCGKITEHRTHCGKETEKVRGKEIINNHVVNIIMSATGLIVGYLSYLYIG